MMMSQNDVIAMEARHKRMLLDILKKYDYTFYAFGSRVKNKAVELSDLDLCIKQEISLATIFNIKSDFQESNLPFKVDLVRWDDCTDDFKKLIEKELVEVSAYSLGIENG